MVDSFIRKQPYPVESLSDVLLLAPVDIPVLFFSLAIPPAQHGLRNAVAEEGLEFNIAAG